MNQLHAALKKWQREVQPNQEPTPPVKERKQFKPSKPQKEIVAGGDILWKPINREAAKLLSKSPWWAQPTTEPKYMKTVPDQFKTEAFKPGVSPEAVRIDTEKSNDQFNAEILSATNRQTVKTIEKTNELIDRSRDARAAMEDLCTSFKAEWLEFQKTADDRLKEIRMLRMSLETETRQLMASFREVRQFFLDKDHASETARLKEFVEVCERLQALKSSGFLDSVAETMLNLAP